MMTLREVSKSFGRLQALNEISFDIQEGKIHGIIGPNGSGKTTLFNCVSGVLPVTGGEISLGTEILSEKPADVIANMGIRRTFQAGKLVPSMTVIENTMCGFFEFAAKDVKDTFCPIPSRRTDRDKRLRRRAMDALDVVGIANLADRWATELAWAERQFVQMARALVSHPRFLLLDEPAAGMGPRETEEVGNLIWKIKERGISVVVISHDMRLLMGVAEKVTVLNLGNLIAQGSPEEVQANPLVRKAYLGTE